MYRMTRPQFLDQIVSKGHRRRIWNRDEEAIHVLSHRQILRHAETNPTASIVGGEHRGSHAHTPYQYAMYMGMNG